MPRQSFKFGHISACENKWSLHIFQVAQKDVLKLPDQSNNIYFCIQWHWNPCTAYTICNGMFALGTKTFFSYVNGENLIWKFFTLLLIRLLYLNIVKNEPTFSECQTILVLNWNTVVSHRNKSSHRNERCQQLPPPSLYHPLFCYFVKKEGGQHRPFSFLWNVLNNSDTTVFEIFRSELWFLQKIYYRKISRPVTLRLNYLDLFQQKWPFLRLFVFHFAAIAFKSGWKSYSPKRSMRWSFPLRLSKSCAVQKSLAYHKIPCTLDERDNLFSGKKKCWLQKM